MSEYRYQIADEMEDVDFGEFDPDAGYAFESDRDCGDDYDAEILAEEMAKNYRDHHDGWEADWPIDIAIFREGGKMVGIFTVELDWMPSYSAGRKNT